MLRNIELHSMRMCTKCTYVKIDCKQFHMVYDMFGVSQYMYYILTDKLRFMRSNDLSQFQHMRFPFCVKCRIIYLLHLLKPK